MPRARKAGVASADQFSANLQSESRKRKRVETEDADAQGQRSDKRTKETNGVTHQAGLSSKSSLGKRKVDVVAADHLEVDQEVDGPIPSLKEEEAFRQRRSPKNKNKVQKDQDAPEPSTTAHRTPSKTGRRPSGRGRKVKAEEEEEEEDVLDDSESIEDVGKSKPKSRRPRKNRTTQAGNKNEESDDPDTGPTPKRKRKTAAEREADRLAAMVPLAARATNLRMFVGAHTSIAKGVENAVTNCVHIGGNAFACFLKSQRKWDNPPLADTNRDAFKSALLEHKYDGTQHIVPHGSYLVNLATEDEAKSAQSYATFIDDLRRCEALGIRYYNFHPGGAGQSPFNEAVARLAGNLNRALAETKTVVPLLENMAGHGTLIGGRFGDLRDVIDLIKPEFRARIGVCIDTCHSFAAGYDLRSPEAFAATMKEFDETVGLKYLKALHLNDSKAPLGSHRDLHQNIGLGFLGLRAFHNVMNFPAFEGLPLILETPCERPDPSDPKGKKTIDDKNVWATEIKLLESLIGMDVQSETFKSLEKDLADKGRKEREAMQKQFDKKVEEQKKKAAKLEKGQTSLRDMFGKKAVKAGATNVKKKGNKKKVKGEESEVEDESSELSDVSS
ncbi:DNA-(apurinic or apyrimidinic site) lyase [Knufia peltigerae]|uniref:Apurinic-apyrimidinic endonuclease 1 n=1 Tax=Knufia peltigerae TaxID=1002370 RepID=A0AA39CW29_9EURO|nr:DNA-(apurinic or apyrimidinic site) lyase [Knufia peltigerae]